jgi:diacylglycerol kinase (ATP)
MKIRFILNPTSGRNRRRPWLAPAIREFIATRSLPAELAVTEGPGHATDLARSAVQAGREVVVAVGGDGTMNEVAQALINTPAALALVPCGSGNGLALHLGLPRSAFGALELAVGAGGRIVTVDTGTANGRPFFNAMGLGLDADVSHRFNRLTRRGLPAYARTAFAALRELRTQRCHVSGGGQGGNFEALLVAVANSDQYGNNARIAPGARVDDGALDLVLIKPVGLVGAAMLVARLFLGNLDASPNVVRIRGPKFAVRRTESGLIHTDGETHETGALVEVVVQPRSLRVLIPAHSRAVAAVDDPLAARFALQLP